MNYQLSTILAFFLVIPAIVGLFRMQKIDQAYFPFLVLIWIGLLNEILTTVIVRNAVNSNIFVLLESLIILWFFEKQGLFSNKRLMWFFIFLFIAFWIIENIFLSSLNRFNSYFRVFYSFIIVLMSIHMITKLMQKINQGLLKNATFLISIGFIAFFTYKCLLEIFWIYGLNASKEFRISVYNILTYINLIVNIIFLIAILWIPRKREFTLL